MIFQGNHVCSGYLLLHKTLSQNLGVEKRNKQKQVHNIPIAFGVTWSVLLLVSSELTYVTAAICSVSLGFIHMAVAEMEKLGQFKAGQKPMMAAFICLAAQMGLLDQLKDGQEFHFLHTVSPKGQMKIYTDADSKGVNVEVNGISRG